MPTLQHKKLLPAYLLTFVNVLGFSILIPILPFVVKDHHAPTWIYGLLLTFYSAFQFLGAPYLGSLSDSLGRKPILLISQAGTLLSWLVFLIAGFIADIPILGLALPIWIIGLSRILDGITGGNTSVTNAYVSDITNRDEKSYVFGYMGGIVGIGMIIGPAIGGLSASTSLGHTGTVLTAIGISIITLITITFWLKESIPLDKRKPRKKESLMDQFYILRRIKREQPNAHIKLLFKLKFFFSMMMAFYIATIALFLIDIFHFDEKELGIFMFIIGIFLSFNQAFISRIFIRKLGEIKTLFIGLTLTVVGLLSITLTTNIYLFISCYYFLNLGLSLCFPTFNALISINAEANNQGEVMGISESIHSFCMASFPIIAAGLYGMIGFHLYYFIAVLPLIAVSIAYLGYKKLDKSLIK